MRPLEDVAGFVAHLVEGVADRRLGRGGHFELGDQAAHLLDISIDGGTVVATQRRRKLHLARVLEDPVAVGRGQDAAGPKLSRRTILLLAARAHQLSRLAFDLGRDRGVLPVPGVVPPHLRTRHDVKLPSSLVA